MRGLIGVGLSEILYQAKVRYCFVVPSDIRLYFIIYPYSFDICDIGVWPVDP